MNFESWLSESHPQIPTASAKAVVALSADGATIPFIARYRKEQTGNLDEVAIAAVINAKESWDTLLRRQEFVVSEIDRQKKLTPELKEKILSTFDAAILEDIYLPFKQKRKTKAAAAKEAGLEPFADWVWNCGHGTDSPQPGQTLELWAFTFHNAEKGYADAAAVIEGAQDIIVERLAETPELRALVRTAVIEKGEVVTGKGAKAKPNSKFENYFDFHEPVSSLVQPQNSHRYLALRRGWMEEELTLSFGGGPNQPEFESELKQAFEAAACTVPDSPGAAVLNKAARLALKAHVLPAIEGEAHKQLKDVADQVAAQVFAENVRKLLLAAPFGPKAVLGVDPGVRTGCKLAVVDDSGKYIASTVIQLQSNDGKEKAKAVLTEVVKSSAIRAVAVGNGTAGRETELFIRGVFKDAGVDVPVVMVSEAGASVYSASDVAREEFPELDVTIRGAISIARRLQDPLAELVKIDPKSIGVGQYQHDVAGHTLKRSLDVVVDSCVNSVGVNLNTASRYLLSHVSGIGDGLAKAIVDHRGEKGLFKSRAELLEVPRFGQKAFEQAAGFLRVAGGEEPLDNTGVHPERYSVLKDWATRLGREISAFLGTGADILAKEGAAKGLKEELGEFTFNDVLNELRKPGRDPREAFVPFQFRDDIHEVKDLKPGLLCPGIVTNVTNFGAFVDIGVHQDGLVHISHLSDRYVKDPREVVSPGDHVQVKVLEVNLDKKQISLSMKSGQAASAGRDANRGEAKTRGSRGGRADGPRGGGQGGGSQGGRAPQPGRAASGAGGRAPKPMPPRQMPTPGGGQALKPKAPAPAFNNAFAGLAALKDTLKKN